MMFTIRSEIFKSHNSEILPFFLFPENTCSAACLTFFNYVAADTNPGLPRDAGVHLSILDRQQVMDDLAAAGEEDYRILMLHWGGKYENSYYPGPQQVKMAREWEISILQLGEFLLC